MMQRQYTAGGQLQSSTNYGKGSPGRKYGNPRIDQPPEAKADPTAP